MSKPTPHLVRVANSQQQAPASRAHTQFNNLIKKIDKQKKQLADWITKLDDFLRLSDRDILTHAGRISHEKAIEFAGKQFEQYRQQQINQPTQVERDFEEATRSLKSLEQGRRKKPVATRKGKGKE